VAPACASALCTSQAHERVKGSITDALPERGDHYSYVTWPLPMLDDAGGQSRDRHAHVGDVGAATNMHSEFLGLVSGAR
jgi:hypothetical protein